MALWKAIFSISLVIVQCTNAASKRPHIIHILADDLGWGELGYHNPEAGTDIKTPNIDNLVRGGLELDRLYAEKICSPSRSSLQSGRLGIHVNVQNVFPEVRNMDDTDGGYQGIPVNMTGMAEILLRAGYRTRAIGKWDIGMATNAHSPWSRGYETWLGYWHHSNDYWTQDETSCSFHPVKDLWRHNVSFSGPELSLQNGPSCADQSQHPESEICVYEEDILMQEVQSVLRAHDPEEPLFMFYSMHLVHMPLQ
ncbi:Arsb, partial [Symbiodinium microadriaticum]